MQTVAKLGGHKLAQAGTTLQLLAFLTTRFTAKVDGERESGVDWDSLCWGRGRRGSGVLVRVGGRGVETVFGYGRRGTPRWGRLVSLR
jgi:hypothetical protein